jgi:S-adenosylmethionine-diacylgycerolhomoserine-N-methlytransferase
MLEHARPRCRFATLARGFAEEADYAAVVGGPPDRILFSYCLSMVQEPWRALAWARRQLAPGGSIAIVDFADLGGLPPLVGGGLRRWIGAFHVRPLDLGRLRAEGAALHLGPGRYYVIARLQG